jgi:AraC family transcriptional regulator
MQACGRWGGTIAAVALALLACWPAAGEDPVTAANKASEVVVEQVPEMTVLVLPMRGSYATHGEAIMKAVGQAASTGVIRGGPFGVYHDNPEQVPEDSLHWDICVPVAAEAKAEAPFQVRKLPAMEAAVLTCTGPYESTAPCWGVLAAWLAKSEYAFGGSPQEHWLSDVRSVPPEQCVARIVFPVVKKDKKDKQDKQDKEDKQEKKQP